MCKLSDLWHIPTALLASLIIPACDLVSVMGAAADWNGDAAAVLEIDKGCISDPRLPSGQSPSRDCVGNRLIESDLGRLLVPSRFTSRAARHFGRATADLTREAALHHSCEQIDSKRTVVMTPGPPKQM